MSVHTPGMGSQLMGEFGLDENLQILLTADVLICVRLHVCVRGCVCVGVWV